MEHVFHEYIQVNSDEMQKDKFDGTLADYACKKLNDLLHKGSFRVQHGDNVRVISIRDSFWTNEIRPSQCDSSTWYDRETCQLSVYLAEKW